MIRYITCIIIEYDDDVIYIIHIIEDYLVYCIYNTDMNKRSRWGNLIVCYDLYDMIWYDMIYIYYADNVCSI